MRKRGGGVIVNTASVAGDSHLPFDPMYSATKKAVMSFTQSCAPFAESDNIRVNAVSPGMVRTAFQGKTGDGERPASWLAPSIERHADSILPPEAIAEAVLDFIRGRLEGRRSSHRRPRLAAYHPRGRSPCPNCSTISACSTSAKAPSVA